MPRIAESGAEYCGVKYYLGNGLTPADKLAVTFELMFDLAFVRRHFRPIELANTVDRYEGRGVDFDTMLYAQSRAGTAFTAEVSDGDMVHPQQVICQFTQLMQKNTLPPGNCNLLIVPYFLYLADKPESLRGMQSELTRIDDGLQAIEEGVAFFGRRLALAHYSVKHIDWLAGQAYALEHGQWICPPRSYRILHHPAQRHPARIPAGRGGVGGRLAWQEFDDDAIRLRSSRVRCRVNARGESGRSVHRRRIEHGRPERSGRLLDAPAAGELTVRFRAVERRTAHRRIRGGRF